MSADGFHVISRKLLQLIEESADKLASELVYEVKKDERAAAYRNVSNERFRALVLDLYKNLGGWLRSRSWGALQTKYERIGRERFQQGMPLSHVVFSVTRTKTMLFDFIREAVQADPSESEREAALLMAISEFFDRAIYNAVVGYQNAQRTSRVGPENERGGKRRSAGRAARGGLKIESTEPQDLPVSRGGDIGEFSG